MEEPCLPVPRLVHTPGHGRQGLGSGGPVVKTLPSNAEEAGLIPGRGAKILHASRPKQPKHKQKPHCKKFNKDFKNGPHQKNLLKKVERIIDKEAQIGHAQALISQT